MVHLVNVVIPGPWWTELTYTCDKDLKDGVRVLVPMGRGRRVGFVSASPESPSCDIKRLRSVCEVIDDFPVMGWELWKLSHWIERVFLCSRGEALGMMLPSPILKGEACPFYETVLPADSGSYREDFVYDPIDETRESLFLDIIRDASANSLILFPEQARAKKFWDSLPSPIKDEGLFWPSTGGKRLLDSWKAVREGKVGTVVGSPAAFSAPFPTPISTLIIDEESSDVWRLQKAPRLNIRSVLAKRARLWRSHLFLAGRIPSSMVYRSREPKPSRMTLLRKRVHFIDIRKGHQTSVLGVNTPLPLSETLIRETQSCLQQGKVALWILDRKGYAGEVACDECGRSILCDACGGVCRLEGNSSRMSCVFCGKSFKLPEVCPSCGGLLLVGLRPGMEALLNIARGLSGGAPSLIWHAGDPKGQQEKRTRIAQLEHGGIVVGSRMSLALCDELSVGTVCWIDVDAEARRQEYSARFSAFSMVLESCWRGRTPEERSVVIQSRSPGRGWQNGLKLGWAHFWKNELFERRELDLPPNCFLLEIQCPDGVKTEMVDSLLADGHYVMDPDPASSKLWIKTRDLNRFRNAVSPFFHIGRSRRGFPLITVWTD